MQTGVLMNPSIDVDDPRAAAIFANHRQRQIVLALIERERSLSELAQIAGMPLNLLHHHVTKLLRLRLIRIAGQRRRAGPAIKLYRAAAAAFFVPAELAAENPGEGMTGALREALERSMAAAYRGVLYSWSEGGPRMHVVKDPGHAADTAELWCSLRLSKADAAALAAEFDALLARYRTRSTNARPRYVVHAAIAPW